MTRECVHVQMSCEFLMAMPTKSFSSRLKRFERRPIATCAVALRFCDAIGCCHGNRCKLSSVILSGFRCGEVYDFFFSIYFQTFFFLNLFVSMIIFNFSLKLITLRLRYASYLHTDARVIEFYSLTSYFYRLEKYSETYNHDENIFVA